MILMQGYFLGQELAGRLQALTMLHEHEVELAEHFSNIVSVLTPSG